jgi:hypothetical protein
MFGPMPLGSRIVAAHDGETRGVRLADRDQPGPHYRGSVMADKSPRQTMSKKSGQTLKQKRATKRSKAEHSPSTIDVLHAKQR